MLPEQFLERMKEMLGEEYPAFAESLEREPYRALRVNLRKGTTDAFLKRWPFPLCPVPWTENGFYYTEAEQPGKHPFHEAGVYYIQEPSAMAPVTFLEVKPGDRVLDLCAAPGGKTTQIADYLKGEGLLVSNEIHPARARILSENVERLGITNAIVTNETPKRLLEEFAGYFDKILVDAPCSGEGMFRKKEEACGEWSLEGVALCAKRQDEVLSCAAGMLRPGGRLVYSTCTFSPEENEGSISRFLKENPDFSIEKVKKPEGFVSGRGIWTEEAACGMENTMRLMPHRVRGEGHFLAVLKKAGDSGADVKRGSRGGTEKSLPQKEYGEFLAFQKAFMQELPKETGLGRLLWQGTCLRFGEQLYAAPEKLPALKGLKILRPGLHLGTLKKNRFEPSHALALALKPEEVKLCVRLGAEEKEAGQYLEGRTLSLQNIRGLCGEEKGWCLVCVEDYSLGWGKLAGGMIKNHYPKGLRKV